MLGDEDGAWILVQSEPSGAVSVSRLPSLIARFFSLQEFLHGPYRVGRSKPLRRVSANGESQCPQTVEFRDRLRQEAESRHGQGNPVGWAEDSLQKSWQCFRNREFAGGLNFLKASSRTTCLLCLVWPLDAICRTRRAWFLPEFGETRSPTFV